MIKLKKSKWMSIIISVIGFVMLAAGAILIKTGGIGNDVAPYLAIGFGCGIFGQGVSEIISHLSEKNYPEISKQREIEENDERNITLRNQAQAKAYRIMIPVFGGLFVAFGLMDVEMKVIVLLVVAYIFVCGCSVFYRIKYEKQM